MMRDPGRFRSADRGGEPCLGKFRRSGARAYPLGREPNPAARSVARAARWVTVLVIDADRVVEGQRPRGTGFGKGGPVHPTVLDDGEMIAYFRVRVAAVAQQADRLGGDVLASAGGIDDSLHVAGIDRGLDVTEEQPSAV